MTRHMIQTGLFLLHLMQCALDAPERLATRRPTHRRGDQRGSVTIEQVIWAGAVIAIVGIVVAAITAYVKSKSGDIN